VKEFEFNLNGRRKIRDKYDLNNSLVLGNVGRLTQQKNQIFSLKIMQKLSKKIPNSKLILLGQGEDEKILRKKVKELKIEKNVIFAGVQKNVNDWYSSFDLLLLTSLYEGLPLTAVEAQANGITMIVNKAVVPKPVSYTHLPSQDTPSNHLCRLHLEKK
ncbi:glycosyltransferase family 1 protein, partial [Lactobacillus crispatus]